MLIDFSPKRSHFDSAPLFFVALEAKEMMKNCSFSHITELRGLCPVSWCCSQPKTPDPNTQPTGPSVSVQYSSVPTRHVQAFSKKCSILMRQKSVDHQRDHEIHISPEALMVNPMLIKSDLVSLASCSQDSSFGRCLRGDTNDVASKSTSFATAVPVENGS